MGVLGTRRARICMGRGREVGVGVGVVEIVDMKWKGEYNRLMDR